jgi:hypothetical protein
VKPVLWIPLVFLICSCQSTPSDSTSPEEFDSRTGNRENRSLQRVGVGIFNTRRIGQHIEQWSSPWQLEYFFDEDNKAFLFRGREEATLKAYRIQEFISIGDQTLEFNLIDDIEMKNGRIFGGGWQHFLSDTWNGKLAFLNASGMTYDVLDRKQGRLSYSALEFALGNQWSWKYFTLGVDWFAYRIPLAMKHGGRKLVTTDYASQDYLLANFGIGFSF